MTHLLNRQFLFWGGLILLSMLLAGCGGGDSSSSTTPLSVTPTSLQFNPPSTTPKTESKGLVVNFGGNFVVLGYAPGVSQPSWVGSVTQSAIAGTAGSQSVTFTLPVNAGSMLSGTYTSSLRVVTGKGSLSNPANLNYVDVPISMRVQ